MFFLLLPPAFGSAPAWQADRFDYLEIHESRSDKLSGHCHNLHCLTQPWRLPSTFHLLFCNVCHMRAPEQMMHRNFFVALSPKSEDQSKPRHLAALEFCRKAISPNSPAPQALLARPALHFSHTECSPNFALHSLNILEPFCPDFP